MREPKLAVPLLLVSTIHPSAQVPLLDFSIIGINKNMIVVITAGGNVDMPTWIDQVPAVLHAWYPGQEGGTALAQIVFGEFSSSGKLPAGFERRWEDNATVANYYPAITRNRWSTKKASLWAIGISTGPGRTRTFLLEFGGLDSPVMVSFDVKNAEEREGSETAEMYVVDQHASVRRPIKERKKLECRAGRVSIYWEHPPLTSPCRASLC
jgi:beta-glucosidase